MKSFCFLLAILSVCQVQAQNYSSPESIEFDYANNRWFISNNGNGQILSRNSATGALSVFATGIPSGPHGLEIVGDTLYACDGGFLKAYDINNASLVFNISLGGSFLNGITHDDNGYLYITDFSAYKIYRFNTLDRTFSVFVSSTGTSSPNGIIYDAPNSRCVFVNWGSNAPIKAMDINTGAISTITSTALGNCDGIAKDLNGNFYVSSWSGGSKVTRFSNGFSSSSTVVSSGLSNPADIFYNVLTDTLGVPNSGSGNNTTYYFFGSASGLQAYSDDELQVHVDVTTAELIVGYNAMTNTDWDMTLMNLEGKSIHAQAVHSVAGWNEYRLPLNEMQHGTYLLSIQGATAGFSKRFVWIQP